MTRYYWETSKEYGHFDAENDAEAIKQMPNDCLILYKEDSKNQLVVVYHSEIGL